MKNDRKSGRYEVTPARLVCPAGALPATGGPMNAARGEMDTLVTLPASIAKATQQGEALARQARRYLQQNQLHELAKLIGDHPGLATLPDIWRGVMRLVNAGRWRNAPGRPRGVFRLNPLLVWGLVKTRCDSGEASSKEQAFHALSRALGYASYDYVKRLYYQAITEPRFQAVLLTMEQPVEVDAVPPSAVKLPPGGQVSYHGTDEAGHALRVTFEDIAGS